MPTKGDNYNQYSKTKTGMLLDGRKYYRLKKVGIITGLEMPTA